MVSWERIGSDYGTEMVRAEVGATVSHLCLKAGLAFRHAAEVHVASGCQLFGSSVQLCGVVPGTEQRAY